MRIPLDDTKGGNDGFQPLPKGTYLVIVDKAEKSKTKSGDSYKWSVTLKVKDGTHKGRLIFDTFVFTEKAQGFVARFLKALGHDISRCELDLDSGSVLYDGTPIKPSDLVGDEAGVSVYIDNKDQNFEPRNRVRKYIPASEFDTTAVNTEPEEAAAPKRLKSPF